ncbi:glycosyltransferase family 4 protein, partial [Vibrio parahaemolyticus]|nr:glycosyltransferase family 4 protein [Vibrio parahaemolyticus]
MMKIAFEQHLNSINTAYTSFFNNHRHIDFKILYKPKLSSKIVTTLRYFFFYLRCFFDFIFKYDLVHINGTKLGFIAYVASFFGCRYIYTIHGFVIDKSYYQNGIIEKLDVLFMKLCCTRAKSVNTISMYSKEKLNEIYGVDSNVIYNGFDCRIFKKISSPEKSEIRKKYNIPLDSIIYISVGRQNKAKNPFLVIDKFIQISKDSDDAFLIMVGDGVLFQNVQSYLDSKGLIGRYLLIRNIPF